MSAIQAKNIAGKLTNLDPLELVQLKNTMKGKLILPSDTTYDETRKIWNAMIDRRPAFIAQCENADDVIATTRFANTHELLISVRGAGHNIAGRALENNVILIDLSQMREVIVDPTNQVITAQPGATLGDVDKATQQYHLALPVGINSTTGIAGLTLGGGFGWLSRKYGMTVDNLLSAEVVTTKGERIVCDHEHYPDLFWALTGGGGNFGIVTSFKFKVHPVEPKVLSGPIIFDAQEANKVLRKLRDYLKTSSEDLSIWAVIRKAPPFPFINKSHHNKLVLILACCYLGSLTDGEKAIDEIKKLGTPLGDGIAPNPFADFQMAFDPLLTPGYRNYWKSHNFKELSDGLIDVIMSHAESLPSPDSEIFLAQMGGVTNRVPNDATAYPHRNVEFIMNMHTRWEQPNQDETCINWAKNLYKAAEPYATGGVYVNFVSEGDDSVQRAYGDNTKRLAEVKQKYDPLNLLRSNLNIAPEGK